MRNLLSVLPTQYCSCDQIEKDEIGRASSKYGGEERCIFSTNTSTEYFKHAANSLFFLLQNAVYFIMLPFLFPVLFTFYIQVC